MLITGPSDAILTTAVEPVRSNYWSLSITGPGNIGSMPALEGLSLRDLPLLGNDQEALDHSPINNTVKYPGKQLPQSVQLRLILLETDPVYSFFVRWRRLCYDPETHLVGLLTDIAGEGAVTIYTTNGSAGVPLPIKRIRIELVWPSSLSYVGLSRDAEGIPLEYQVMLEIGNSYDVNP